MCLFQRTVAYGPAASTAERELRPSIAIGNVRGEGRGEFSSILSPQPMRLMD